LEEGKERGVEEGAIRISLIAVVIVSAGARSPDIRQFCCFARLRKSHAEIIEQQRYLPFGQPRELPNYQTIQLTDYTYTGQRDLPGSGLMDYKARFYSPALGRFIQPDSIVPNAAKPQAFNRYSYVLNNPLLYTDPTGHREIIDNDKNGKPILAPWQPSNNSGGGNKPNHDDDDGGGGSGPRSTLVYDFELFSEIQWFTNVVPIDSAQMQGFCYRNYGPDVECGRSPTRINTPSEINLRIDTIGIRFDASGWGGVGADVNVDLLYFGTSNEIDLFVSPGRQMGSGGGFSFTIGILIGQNMPGRGSYSGVSNYGGAHIPVVPLGNNLEGEHSLSLMPNDDGTYAATTYIGAAPLQPEVGGYTGVSTTVSVTDLWQLMFGK